MCLVAAMAVAACGDGAATEAPQGTAAATDGGAADGADPLRRSDADAGVGGEDAADVGVRCSGKTGLAGDAERRVTVGGVERSFLLHVPPGYRSERGAAVVLAFHGFTESPQQMRAMSHYDEVADARGYIVAYPAGLNGSFNAGACCGTSALGNVDDVAFVRALLDSIQTTHCVDAKRVFASGFSNGGFLSHRLACELSDRVAAIGVESGQNGLPTCTPTRPVPVAQVHGTGDPVVPFGGNVLLGFRPTMDTMQAWADRNGCGASRVVTLSQGGTRCEAWQACRDDATVTLCKVEGGGHDWFGGGSLWTDAGPPPGFNTTRFFADFFDAHPMRP
jgi:polyhydroxybutyrate depolymerase